MKVAAQSSKEVKNSVSTTLANSNRRPILKIPQYLRLQINSWLLSKRMHVGYIPLRRMTKNNLFHQASALIEMRKVKWIRKKNSSKMKMTLVMMKWFKGSRTMLEELSSITRVHWKDRRLKANDLEEVLRRKMCWWGTALPTSQGLSPRSLIRKAVSCSLMAAKLA